MTKIPSLGVKWWYKISSLGVKLCHTFKRHQRKYEKKVYESIRKKGNNLCKWKYKWKSKVTYPTS